MTDANTMHNNGTMVATATAESNKISDANHNSYYPDNNKQTIEFQMTDSVTEIDDEKLAG